jgi:putative phosphoesterase
MVHGDMGRRNAHENAVTAFSGDRLDVIAYGHSHRPIVERRDGVIVTNPGSPTDKRMMPTYSYGIMTVDGNHVSVDLRFYDSRD